MSFGPCSDPVFSPQFVTPRDRANRLLSSGHAKTVASRTCWAGGDPGDILWVNHPAWAIRDNHKPNQRGRCASSYCQRRQH